MIEILKKIFDIILALFNNESTTKINSDNTNSNNKFIINSNNKNINKKFVFNFFLDRYNPLYAKNKSKEISISQLTYLKYFVAFSYLVCFFFVIKENFALFITWVLWFFPLKSIFNEDCDFLYILIIFTSLLVLFSPLTIEDILNSLLNILIWLLKKIHSIYLYLKDFIYS